MGRSRSHSHWAGYAWGHTDTHSEDINGPGGAGGYNPVPDINSHLGWNRLIGVLFATFQRPLLCGAVNLPQIVDAGVRLRCVARADEVWQSNSRQQTDDGHDDHYLHQGEP